MDLFILIVNIHCITSMISFNSFHYRLCIRYVLCVSFFFFFKYLYNIWRLYTNLLNLIKNWFCISISIIIGNHGRNLKLINRINVYACIYFVKFIHRVNFIILNTLIDMQKITLDWNSIVIHFISNKEDNISFFLIFIIFNSRNFVNN